MLIAGAVLCVAHNRDKAWHGPLAHGAGKVVQAVAAHEAGFAPGAEADEVQSARSRRNGVSRQRKAKLVRQESFSDRIHPPIICPRVSISDDKDE